MGEDRLPKSNPKTGLHQGKENGDGHGEAGAKEYRQK